MMFSSATGCSCSTSPAGSASRRRAASSVSTAPPTTAGRRRSTGTASRCCGRGSAASRGCRTSSRRWWRSGSSPSRSPIPASARGGSPRSWGGRSGAGSSSRTTAPGECSAGTGSTPAPSGSRSWPATAHPYEPPREPRPEPHIDVSRPGELVGFDCFFVGRLKGTSGVVWQLSAIDCYSSFAWAELVVCAKDPSAEQTPRLARRAASDLKRAGWRLERVLCDNGKEFKAEVFRQAIAGLGARVTHIRSGRPQTNGHVEALHRLILEECWRPAFARYLYPRYTGLKRELERYLGHYDFDRVHHGRLTNGRIPADLVYGARKMEAR
jgi:hypothetical protein